MQRVRNFAIFVRLTAD